MNRPHRQVSLIRRLGRSIACAAIAAALLTLDAATVGHDTVAAVLATGFVVCTLVFSMFFFVGASFVAWTRKLPVRDRELAALERQVGEQPADRYQDRDYETGDGWR